MSVKIKAGTCFVLPVTIVDSHFEDIESVEFIFTQSENGETIKSALWSKNGECRDAERVAGENKILVLFTREDSYLFRQNDMFFLDTRIHYTDAMTNPYTQIRRIRMNKTLFKSGEEVGA